MLLLNPSKLINKLVLACPNSEYCRALVSQEQLQQHLQKVCPGRLVDCPKCSYHGPLSDFYHHLCTENESHHLSHSHSFSHVSGHSSIHEKAYKVIRHFMLVELYRGENHSELGFRFVGGADTPLQKKILIQSIVPGGLANKDGRLRPGDHIVGVNGKSFCNADHMDAWKGLTTFSEVCSLVIYRERCESARGRRDVKSAIFTRNEEDHHIKFVDDTNVLHTNKNMKTSKSTFMCKHDWNLTQSSNRNNDFSISRNGTARRNKDNTTTITQRVQSDIKSQKPRSRNGKCITSVITSTNDANASLCHSAQPVAPNATKTSHFYESEKSLSLNPPPLMWKEELLTVIKHPEENLGFSLSGGNVDIPIGSVRKSETLSSSKGRQYQSVPLIYVAQDIGDEGNVHWIPRKIRPGDVLLGVNEYSLINVGHHTAVNQIKRCTIGQTTLTLRVLRCPKSLINSTNTLYMDFTTSLSFPRSQIPTFHKSLTQKTSYSFDRLNELWRCEYDSPKLCRKSRIDISLKFEPSWIFWLSIPLCYCTPKTVILDEMEDDNCLGFNIIGGVRKIHQDSMKSHQNGKCFEKFIFVESICPGSPLSHLGLLKCGDILLSVNDHLLTDVVRQEAVNLLRSAKRPLHLRVLTWPGALV